MKDLAEIKEQAKAAVNLADYVRETGIELQGGPAEFKGLCPFHSEKTPSFTVNVDKRVFYCFGCEAGGDIFEFVMKSKGLDFVGAVQLIANRAGMAVPEKRLYQPIGLPSTTDSHQRSRDPEKSRPIVEGGKVWNYLTALRELDPAVLSAYSMGETSDGQAYVFHYEWVVDPECDQAGETIKKYEFSKVIRVDRDPNGKKIEWREPKGGKSILYGMPAIRAQTRELIISEGEIDSLSYATYGFPAVSVPGGACNLGWIDTCYDWLKKFEKIHISFDEDRAGRARVIEIVTRLGAWRTDIIRLPEKKPGIRFKDINECLQAKVARELVASAISNPEMVTPQALKSILDFEDPLWQRLHMDGIEQLGLPLPWKNSRGQELPFRFRRGEVTVWTGFNKHGKSEVLNHCIVHLCSLGERALICSLEVPAVVTYHKLLRMVMGKRDVWPRAERDSFHGRCLKTLAHRIWVYDHVGNVPIESVENVMLYAFRRHGCRQFVLDSLMRFQGLDGEGQEQWNLQRDFMNRLINFAQLYNVHIHLVAHCRKPDRQGEGMHPRRYDISGSAHISNLPNNVIVIWRNRDKQEKLDRIFDTLSGEFAHHDPTAPIPDWRVLQRANRAGGSSIEESNQRRRIRDFIHGKVSVETRTALENLLGSQDAYLIVDAQRGGDGECPTENLWFDSESLQFLEANPCTDRTDKAVPAARPVDYSMSLTFSPTDES